jgi:cytochrome b
LSDPINDLTSAAREGSPPMIVVWDAPLRIFHWALAASVLIAWFSANVYDTVHEVAGYTVIGLLVFRLVWGFVGAPHARFRDFANSPRAILIYLRAILGGHPRRYLGHNPAGAAMIFTLLILLAAISASGWMQLTVQFFGVTWVEKIHTYSSNLVIFLAIVHVLGVIVASVQHRENLLRAMITGQKEFRAEDSLAGEAPPSAEN